MQIAVGIWFVVGLGPAYHGALRLRSWVRADVVVFRSFYFWVSLLMGLGMLFNLVRALAPPHGYTDPLAYQLALPKIYLLEHHLSFEPTINGTLYPSNMGLLYVVAIALRNGILAQIIHWMMALMTMVAIVGFCRRFFTWQTGVFAAAIFSFVPVVVTFAPLAYVDLGLCFFQFCAFWAILEWARERQRAELITAALLTGLALCVKHQGLATLLLGSIVVASAAVRGGGLRQGVSQTGLFIGLSLLVLAPWYLRAFLYSGNPLWPLANEFFEGEPFGRAPSIVAGAATESVHEYVVSVFLPLEWLSSHWEALSFWRWTFQPTMQHDIGVYFVALLPGLAFCRRRWEWSFIAFCAGYYLIMVRFLHMNPRYSFALVAFAAVLCGLVAERLSTMRIPAAASVFKIAFLCTCLFNLVGEYRQADPVFQVATGGESREDFLRRSESNFELFSYVNRHLPDDSIVLLQGIVKGYYCDRKYLWDHPLQAVLSYEGQSADSLFLRMNELGITHIARMINIPPGRRRLGYPQYFADSLHEEFRNRYLRLEYHDRGYALFALRDAERAVSSAGSADAKSFLETVPRDNQLAEGRSERIEDADRQEPKRTLL